MTSRAISFVVIAFSLALGIVFGLGSTQSQELNLQEQDQSSAVSSSPDVDVRLPGLHGNPLWGLLLDALPATAERPIFSPSRRPPPGVTIVPYQAPRPATMNQSLQPALSLLGVVSGNEDGVAIFLDATSNSVIRMKLGESHTGWTLQSLGARHAIFQRGRDTATVALSNPVGK